MSKAFTSMRLTAKICANVVQYNNYILDTDNLAHLHTDNLAHLHTGFLHLLQITSPNVALVLEAK